MHSLVLGYDVVDVNHVAVQLVSPVFVPLPWTWGKRGGGGRLERTLTCVRQPAAEPQSLFEPPVDPPRLSCVVRQNSRSLYYFRRRDAGLRHPTRDCGGQHFDCSQIHDPSAGAGWDFADRGRETDLVKRIAAAVADTGSAIAHGVGGAAVETAV